MERETRVVRWAYAALVAIGTLTWALGREGHGLPTADLHADAPYYYVYWPSLLRGDLDFSNEYRETKNWYHFGTTPTGRVANVFGIGPAIVDAPLLGVAHVLAWVTGSRTDGFSTWEVRAYTWSSLAWSLAAVLMAARLARRRVDAHPLRAAVGPLMCALAGPVVYYAVRQPGYAHPMATFFIAWLVERWDASYDGPRTTRTWLVLGALLGAAALVRPQLALWSVLLAGAAIDDVRVERRARVALRWLAGAAAALAVFAPQLVAWKLLYGEWYAVPQGAGFMRWDAPCWSEVLFSSRNGLLPWAPAYVGFALALAALARRQPRLVLLLAIGCALQVLANGAVWDWWAGGSFGGRRFDSTFVVFALGAAVVCARIAHVVIASGGDAAALARATRWRARAAVALAGIAALVIVLLVVANLELVARTTTTSTRITGGESPATVWRRRCDPISGTVAAATAWLGSLPARVVFSWRHGAPLDAYDQLVGVYVLGETFPGLNSYGDVRVATLPAPALDASGHARVFVGLNRRGAIDVTIPVSAPASITWNGQAVERHFRTDDFRRGVNELEIATAPGEQVGAIRVEALDP